MAKEQNHLANLLEELNRKIGQEIHLGEWFEVSQQRITQFGQVTEDHQWIHMDVERATAESPFGGPIAHGFFVLALIPHLTGIGSATADQYPGAKQVVNYGLNKVRFVHPVMAGARIRSRKTLTDIKTKENSVDLAFTVTIEIQGVEKPACVAETLSRIYF